MIKEHCIDTIQPADRLFGGRISWNTWLRTGVFLLADDMVGLFNVVVIWQSRARDRHQLRQMSFHMLKDIGLDHHTIETECRKPFWQA